MSGGVPGAAKYVYGDEDRAPQQAFDPNKEEVVAQAALGAGILLSQGCEIDHSPQIWLALIRTLRSVPLEHQDAVVSGANFRFLYLPENDDPPFEASYLDFSRITTVRVAAMTAYNRILSASDDLIRALYVGITRYITRFDLRPTVLNDVVARAISEASEP